MTNFDLEVLVLTSDESQHFNTLNLSEKSLFFPHLSFTFFMFMWAREYRLERLEKM